MLYTTRKFRLLLCAALLLLSSAAAHSTIQKKTSIRPEEQREPKVTPIADAAESMKDEAKASTPRYFYEFRQPEFVVSHIKIEHDGAGRGRITFERKNDAEAIVEPFELSPPALERVTALWGALRFLDSETNYQAAKQFPHLGTMRLHMIDGKRERTTEFNWTRDRDASALINEYRRAADQSMFVFEINLSRELQPLESPKLLTRLDSLLARNGLSDPRQLLPLLRDLNTDERLPLIARNHAGRLLKKIEK